MKILRLVALWFVCTALLFVVVKCVSDQEIPTAVMTVFTKNTYAVADSYSWESRSRSGSGVWLDHHTFLTACHVVNGMSRLPVVHSYDHTIKHAMRIDYCDTQMDVAVLKAEWPNINAKRLRIRAKDPFYGEHVWSAGYRYGLGMTPKDGYAAAQLEGTSPLQVYAMIADHGDSGSPIFDSNGALLGLVLMVPVIPVTTFMEQVDVTIPGLVYSASIGQILYAMKLSKIDPVL